MHFHISYQRHRIGPCPDVPMPHHTEQVSITLMCPHQVGGLLSSEWLQVRSVDSGHGRQLTQAAEKHTDKLIYKAIVWLVRHIF